MLPNIEAIIKAQGEAWNPFEYNSLWVTVIGKTPRTFTIEDLDGTPLKFKEIPKVRRSHVPKEFKVYSLNKDNKPLGFVYYNDTNKDMSIWTYRYKVREEVYWGNLLRYLYKNRERGLI